MDSRAKQRITGAVILVAVFVLLVPELLRGPGKDRGTPAAPVTTPDETGLRQYTIDLNAPANPAQPAPEAAGAVALPAPSVAQTSPMAAPGEAATPESPPSEPPTPEPETPEPETPEPQPATSPPAAAPPTPVAATPAAKPATTPAVTPATTPAATPRAGAPTATASPTTSPRPASTPPAGVGGGFAVQLGSFAVRDNAERLAREMTAKGFAASVAPLKVKGRELYRVLVGPTRDRAAAEALAAQLRRIGQAGSIVSIS